MKLTILGKFGAFPAVGGGTSSYLITDNFTAVSRDEVYNAKLNENLLVNNSKINKKPMANCAEINHSTQNNAELNEKPALNILLDCGSGAISRLQHYVRPENLDAIVLSHLHNDHMCDLLPLAYYLQVKCVKLDLFMPQCDCPQADFIKTLDCYNIKYYDESTKVIIGHEKNNGEKLNTGSMNLSFFKMIHPLLSFAVKVSCGGKTLFYSGDTTINNNITQNIGDCDILLMDGGKADGSSAQHMSLAEIVNIAEKSKIQTIVTHINPSLEYNAQSKFVKIAEELAIYNV